MADLFTTYQRRATDIGTAVPDGLTISSVQAFPGSVFAYGLGSFMGLVLADCGIAVTVPDGERDSSGGVELSLELLGALTADVLFVWTAFETDPDAVLDELRATPLWATLPAVTAGRVYPVGTHWIGDGLAAARLVLDDLTIALT